VNENVMAEKVPDTLALPLQQVEVLLYYSWKHIFRFRAARIITLGRLRFWGYGPVSDVASPMLAVGGSLSAQ
jgi:hypothetical protein